MKFKNTLSNRKTQLKLIKILLTIFKYFMALSILGLIALNIYVAFQPLEKIKAQDSHNSYYSIQISTSETQSFGVSIPNNVMGYSSPDLTSKAKYMYSIYSLTNGGLYCAFLLVGTIFLINLINDTLKESTPFSMKHIKEIKLISFFIIINFGLKDFIINILFSIFIFKVNAVHLINIHIYGILFGVVIYLIAIIFDYGRLLQEDADSIV